MDISSIQEKVNKCLLAVIRLQKKMKCQYEHKDESDKSYTFSTEHDVLQRPHLETS